MTMENRKDVANYLQNFEFVHPFTAVFVEGAPDSQRHDFLRHLVVRVDLQIKDEETEMLIINYFINSGELDVMAAATVSVK